MLRARAPKVEGMRSNRRHPVPVWLRAALWSIAIGLTLVGIIAAAASSSAWPLLAVAGLALPILPLGTPRTSD